MNQKYRREAENAVHIEKTEGHITFEHVKLGYSPDRILITDMNAEIKHRAKGRDLRADRRRKNDAHQPVDAFLRPQWRGDHGSTGQTLLT